MITNLHINGYHRIMVNAVDNVLKYQVTMWLLFNIIIYNFYFFFFIKETCPDFSSNCQLKSLSSDIIRTDNCVSLQKVEREECSGRCPSMYSNSFQINDGLLYSSYSSFSCCKPYETFNQTITMECFDQGLWARQEVTYFRIKSCACLSCSF